MPAPADFAAINGYHYSWASIEFSILGEVTKYFNEITYTDAHERGMGRGTSGRKKIRTRGETSPEASATLYKRQWDELLALLRTKAAEQAVAVRDLPFTITVSYADNGQAIQTDTLEDCLLGQIETNPSEGTDPAMVEIELDVMRILWNGIDLDEVQTA